MIPTGHLKSHGPEPGFGAKLFTVGHGQLLQLALPPMNNFG